MTPPTLDFFLRCRFVVAQNRLGLVANDHRQRMQEILNWAGSKLTRSWLGAAEQTKWTRVYISLLPISIR